ncbi:MAG: hypothetical protein QM831_03120 [Kofleriaceae bacterium]
MGLSLAEVIMAINWAVPLVVGVPVMIWGSYGDDKKPLRRTKRKTADAAPEGKTLAPLRCPQCSSPVPLQPTESHCPSCNALVKPPEDYVQLFQLRRAAMFELRRAERRWRWSRWSSSIISTTLIRLVFTAWFVAVCYAAITVDWGGMSLIGFIFGLFELVGGWYGAWAYGIARKTLPRLPKTHELNVPAAPATCLGCGGPIQFGASELSLICPYCGADNYRESLARAVHGHARENERAAGKSLLDATRELEARQQGLQGFAVFMAIAVMFYGAMLVLVWIGDAAGC